MKPVTGLLLSFICLGLQLSAQVNEVKTGNTGPPFFLLRF